MRDTIMTGSQDLHDSLDAVLAREGMQPPKQAEARVPRDAPAQADEEKQPTARENYLERATEIAENIDVACHRTEYSFRIEMFYTPPYYLEKRPEVIAVVRETREVKTDETDEDGEKRTIKITDAAISNACESMLEQYIAEREQSIRLRESYLRPRCGKDGADHLQEAGQMPFDLDGALVRYTLAMIMYNRDLQAFYGSRAEDVRHRLAALIDPTTIPQKARIPHDVAEVMLGLDLDLRYGTEKAAELRKRITDAIEPETAPQPTYTSPAQHSETMTPVEAAALLAQSGMQMPQQSAAHGIPARGSAAPYTREGSRLPPPPGKGDGDGKGRKTSTPPLPRERKTTAGANGEGRKAALPPPPKRNGGRM